MKKKQEYHPGKIRPLAQVIARLVQNDPRLADNADRLWSTILVNIPQLQDRTSCANCGGSMAEYVFEFDLLDALLLLAMARAVRSRTEYDDFTEANQVRVQDMTDSTYAVRSRTTQCAKLGLIAKMRGQNGKQIPGTWVITKRGFAALRGEPVPRSVRVWHGQILERTEELMTISEALRSHQAKIEELLRRHKQPKADYRDAFADYDPNEWVHFAGMHQGELL